MTLSIRCLTNSEMNLSNALFEDKFQVRLVSEKVTILSEIDIRRASSKTFYNKELFESKIIFE